MILALLICVLSCLSRIIRRLRFFGHLLQLEGYQIRSYRNWLTSHFRDAVFRTSHVVGLGLIGLIGLGVLLTGTAQTDVSATTIPSRWALIGIFVAWSLIFSSSRRYRRDRPKKPLVFTSRVKRVFALASVITLVVATAPVLLLRATAAWTEGLGLLSGLFLADLFAPISVGLAVLLLEPLERSYRSGFKKDARARLASAGDLDVIAITGSYGKTSVKFAVESVLSHLFDVLATPGSFNTPMGICRVINDQLRDHHQMLVLEMGMRFPGDIAELCDIARPDVAIITSVGVAHLESMGSIDAIEKEKASLLEFLKDGGHAVLNGDDERVRRMHGRQASRVWVVSTDPSVAADLTASQIEYSAEGSTFIASESGGDSISIKTRLLGRHNISNILLAIAVGRIYGLRLRQIRHAIERLKPIPHRLELKRTGAITIIDDAFNSNPVGARNAVEILGQFETGRRVIVTPGMIELGERQDEENRLLGRHIATNVDLAILVGENQTRAIARGLEDARFPIEQIRIVKTLFEAQDFIRISLGEGDVVLFENDLPDQYNEA